MANYNQTSSFNTEFARQWGIIPALVFDELSFWGQKSINDGWFYLSYDDMQKRLPVSEYQLRTAYKVLTDHGFIEQNLRKISGAPTLHFRLLKNLRFDSQKTTDSIDSVKTSESYKEAATETATEHEENSLSSEGEASEKQNTVDVSFTTAIDLLVEELGVGKPRNYEQYRAKFKARSKSFSFAEIARAATNIGRDPFMIGQNDGKKRYGTLEYLLRNDAKMQEWLEKSPVPKTEGAFEIPEQTADDEEGDGLTYEQRKRYLDERMGKQ